MLLLANFTTEKKRISSELIWREFQMQESSEKWVEKWDEKDKNSDSLRACPSTFLRNQKNKQKNYKAYKDMILMKYKFL